eukprot:2974477-Pyramimonas_sp.AAC.1
MGKKAATTAAVAPGQSESKSFVGGVGSCLGGSAAAGSATAPPPLPGQHEKQDKPTRRLKGKTSMSEDDERQLESLYGPRDSISD